MHARSAANRQVMAPPGSSSQSQLELLERRWATTARQAAAHAEALYLRTAVLAAAVHYSRHIALHWGWVPWRALVEQAKQRQHAAAVLCAQHAVARMLQAVQAWRRLAAWRAVTAEACATAAARHHHQHRLLQSSVAMLAQHARRLRELARLHPTWLAIASLRHWRQLGAAAAAQARQHSQMAAAHSDRRAAHRVLKAWRLCSKLAARREKRWGDVQRYLAEYRAAREGQARAGCSGADGTASNLSSAENSFDPNSIFNASPRPLHC